MGRLLLIITGLTWQAKAEFKFPARGETIKPSAQSTVYQCNKYILIEINSLKYKQVLNRLFVNHKVNSPFIDPIIKAWYNEKNYYLLKEFHHQGDLRGKVFDEKKLKIYADELLLAIEALHKKNIIHRDIKPDNILLGNDGHIRLIDFGLSIKSETKTMRLRGTPNYLAPECILYKDFSDKSDLWAYACTLYELSRREILFRVKKLRKRRIYEQLNWEGLTFDDNSNFFNLISKILHLDPDKRPSMSKIKQDPWFAGINWELLALEERPPPKQTKKTMTHPPPKIKEFEGEHTEIKLYKKAELKK